MARIFVPLLAHKRYKGARGGRGSGKSQFFVDRLLEETLANPLTRAVCVREVQRSLKQSVKQLIEDKIVRSGLESRYESKTESIRVLDDRGRYRGGQIIFQGMQNHTAETFKSLEGYNIAFVEEAQSITQRSFTILTPTLRAPGSQLWFAWNPRSPKDPVDEFFVQAHHPSSMYVDANYPDNPWFPEDLRMDMEVMRRHNRERWEHVWLGKYQSQSESQVFRNWRIGDEEEFRTTSQTRFYYGCDWGFTIDPSVIVRMFLEGRKLYIDRESYRVGCEIVDLPKLFDKLDNGQARRWPCRADSSRPDVISHLNKHGYPRVVPCRKGAGSVEEGIEFLQSHEIIVHPECAHTIDELTNYSYKIDPKTEEVIPVLADKDNHVIDSIRYALEDVRSSSYTLMQHLR